MTTTKTTGAVAPAEKAYDEAIGAPWNVYNVAPQPETTHWHKQLQEALAAARDLLWAKVQRGGYHNFDHAEATLAALANTRKALSLALELSQLPLPEPPA